MNLLGTTGTQHINDVETLARLDEYIFKPETKLYWESFDGFVSGACKGWDAVWGYRMALTYPNKKHIVVVPANRSKVDPWWELFDLGYVEVIEMPEDSDYRARNEKIVELASALFYCAQYPEDHGSSLRSGTWMTVRIGRRSGMIPVGIVINDTTKDDE